MASGKFSFLTVKIFLVISIKNKKNKKTVLILAQLVSMVKGGSSELFQILDKNAFCFNLFYTILPY